MTTKTNKVTVICTIKNEVKTLASLVTALVRQTTTPDEVIIIDGGSTDGSPQMLAELSEKKFPFAFTFEVREGNRSIGRNRAIKLARNGLVAITDAGCIPDTDWLEQLLTAYRLQEKPVIAGYAIGEPKSDFEEAVVPYALVMPDRVKPNAFLPATRSMLIEKSVWSQLHGFDEHCSLNEDYEFARRMQDQGVPIGFTQEAVVRWMPRSSLQAFWRMIYSFARGDARAGLWRGKVLLICLRYVTAGCLVLLVNVWAGLIAATTLILVGGILYSIWSIQKNRAYVPNGWYWLPALQVVSDIAVIYGTVCGLIDQVRDRK